MPGPDVLEVATHPYQGLCDFHYARMLHMDTNVMICARAISVSVLVTYVNKGEKPDELLAELLI